MLCLCIKRCSEPTAGLCPGDYYNASYSGAAVVLATLDGTLARDLDRVAVQYRYAASRKLNGTSNDWQTIAQAQIAGNFALSLHVGDMTSSSTALAASRIFSIVVTPSHTSAKQSQVLVDIMKSSAVAGSANNIVLVAKDRFGNPQISQVDDTANFDVLLEYRRVDAQNITHTLTELVHANVSRDEPATGGRYMAQYRATKTGVYVLQASFRPQGVARSRASSSSSFLQGSHRFIVVVPSIVDANRSFAEFPVTVDLWAIPNLGRKDVSASQKSPTDGLIRCGVHNRTQSMY